MNIYAIILNSKADKSTIAEYMTLKTAKLHFDKIGGSDNVDVFIELAKYDENNKCLDWDDEELESIGQPVGQLITKQI